MRPKGHHWFRGAGDIDGKGGFIKKVRAEKGVCARHGKDKIIGCGGINEKKRVVWAESSYLATSSGPGFRSLYHLSFGTCAWFRICSRFWFFVGHLSHSEAFQWSTPGLLTLLYMYTPIAMTTSHTLQL